MQLKTEGTNVSTETSHRIFKSLQDVFDKILALPSWKGQSKQRKINLLVAFSGGCDSVCLLRSLAEFPDPRKGTLTAVHVHHGLSPNADAWADFTTQVAKQCEVPFVLRKVQIGKSRLGLEAEARRLRYQALNEVAQEIGADAILTAHHRDDQLETFLIQWMRGAGIEGLAGMPLISNDSIPIGRPFLNLGRKDLESYAQARNWKWIEDESNTDPGYLRNLIRLQILPVLDKTRPGYRKAAARSIQLLAESAEILKATDEEDFNRVCGLEEEATGLEVAAFLKLSAPKRSRMLRHWLRTQGAAQVPKHRIDFILQKMKDLEKDKTCRLMKFGDRELLFQEGFLRIENVSQTNCGYDIVFHWKEEKTIEFPEFNGRLLFEKSKTGFPAEWLKEKTLSISLRKGKDRMKTKADSPPKLIKVLCQEAGIDPTERAGLPVVRREGQIIYASGLGSELRVISRSLDSSLISIRWQKYEKPTS